MGYEQFGPIGGEIARYAGELIGYFSAEPEGLRAESQDVPKPDYLALEAWLELEGSVPLIDVSMDVDGEDRRKLHDTLLAFHTALPFNEAERGWLDQMHDRLCERSVKDIPRMIEGYEDRIMMAGVQQVVNGRDLMRRWAAWRRETDEFAGQGSLDQAREALLSVQELLS
jgi:hypothetical protein